MGYITSLGKEKTDARKGYATCTGMDPSASCFFLVYQTKRPVSLLELKRTELVGTFCTASEALSEVIHLAGERHLAFQQDASLRSHPSFERLRAWVKGLALKTDEKGAVTERQLKPSGCKRKRRRKYDIVDDFECREQLVVHLLKEQHRDDSDKLLQDIFSQLVMPSSKSQMHHEVLVVSMEELLSKS